MNATRSDTSQLSQQKSGPVNKLLEQDLESIEERVREARTAYRCTQAARSAVLGYHDKNFLKKHWHDHIHPVVISEL